MKIENAQKAVELYKELNDWKKRFNEVESLHKRIIEGYENIVYVGGQAGMTRVPREAGLSILTTAMSYYMQTIKDLERQIEEL